MKLKMIFRFLIRLVGVLAALILLYLLAAVLLTAIPVNSDFTETANGIKVLVVSNGKHTDVFVPVVADDVDWTQVFPLDDFEVVTDTPACISFGWGDKGFFLETPSWDEVKTTTTLNALFVPSSSFFK